jgi:photosystem II stability/assembly factor-like uncharacterized protein
LTTRAPTKRPTKGRVQRPQPRHAVSPRVWLPLLVVALAAIGLGVVLAAPRLGDGGGSKGTSTGLPNTPDYHSLLVSPTDSRDLLLGTHQGLYRSRDGGRTWRFAALSGNDAMNLSSPNGKTIWLAGHNVFKKSVDAGASWEDVRPSGLASLDIHGFTVDPRNPRVLLAAVAGQGFYRSLDGGGSFTSVSTEVGGNVMALAATKDGRVLAGDMQQGLLESRDGGKTWRVSLPAHLMGLVINPRQPQRVLAAGPGIARSLDGGRNWKLVLDLPDGAGPVAWATSKPNIAYVVGFNRTLYRTLDAGNSWEAVR